MTMVDYLKNVLKLPTDVPLNTIAEMFTFLDIPKKDTLYKMGTPVTKLSFLVKGTMVGVRENADGHMVVECIPWRSGDSVTAIQELEASDQSTPINLPGQLNTLWNRPTFALCDVVALEDTRVAQISNENVQLALETYPKLLFWVSNRMHEAFQQHWETKTILDRYNSAQERYLWFLREYPGVIDRISNTYVAAFLGMDPATLSRQKRKHLF